MARDGPACGGPRQTCPSSQLRADFTEAVTHDSRPLADLPKSWWERAHWLEEDWRPDNSRVKKSNSARFRGVTGEHFRKAPLSGQSQGGNWQNAQAGRVKHPTGSRGGEREDPGR
ncbi:hypothetical protein GCM10010277_83010 [Streptomyces longisporoflavus]|nr:hypothetical protein GCM10010277_83010 [Streptomyces longisporoflavus]